MVKNRPVSQPPPECIRLRGVRQNNLTGFDLDVPLGRYVIVTGLSGSGKSSLVFDTLHAEGQRRYVETFSAYTRQFLDLLDKPRVDSVENIRPSIAIEQTNTIKTSRSTVGTMTELTDFFKVWFSHVAECFDPATGEKVEDDTPATIWAKTSATTGGVAVIIAFEVRKPENLTWPEILQNLKGQSYVRVLVAAAGIEVRGQKSEIRREMSVDGPGSATPATSEKLTAWRVDELLADLGPLQGADRLFVAQDRITIIPENRGRCLEALEAALHFGQGQVRLFAADTLAETGHFSRGLHSPKTGRTFRAATPALFSFNSPLGACPKCRGFGRVIEIDYRLALPDRNLSLDDGAIKAWEGEIYSDSKRDLRVFAKKNSIPTNVPFATLTPEQQSLVIDGEPGYGGEGKTWPRAWYGLKGFFRWLEKNTYKMQVRIFLSRYRTYNLCPDCGGARLQPEALCWKWRGRKLPELYQLPVSDLLALMAHSARPAKAWPAGQSLGDGGMTAGSRPENHSAQMAFDSIVTRLRYLEQVGLAYLTLDRASRTLSGGEVQRVNLTSCLGTSLTDTLFVLDEPSVGLHPRDIARLIAIIRSLTTAGNTVVVVEHDEAMIRAADQVIEVGPGPGRRGGRITFQGPVAAMLSAPNCITGAYFSGREAIPTPARRRPIVHWSLDIRHSSWLTFTDASKHNLHDLTVRIPLGRLVGLSGVSGSGKSTLLEQVIYQGLLTQRHQLTEDPAAIGRIEGGDALAEIVLVDQSPLSRTPRSNPALYTGAWELIRELFAATPAAQAAGFTHSSFSFNSGDGRCDHCNGLGYERVEMQFLSDVFVPCPVCESRRFKRGVLAITWRGVTVHDLLNTSVDDALVLFAGNAGGVPPPRDGAAATPPRSASGKVPPPREAARLATIQQRLAPLAAVGLGYLALGQPLNTLSGGESQRLKLVRYLGAFTSAAEAGGEIEAESDGSGGSDRSDQVDSGRQKSKFPSGALLLLDEPTTGLHRHDVKLLLTVLQALVDRGHSVVVIEHNLDVLKAADWIIEVGPDAGAAGGRIVAEGTPEEAAAADTATSPFLRAALRQRQLLVDIVAEPLAAEEAAPYRPEDLAKCHLLVDIVAEPLAAGGGEEVRGQMSEVSGHAGPGVITIVGARENNLQNLSLTIPHRQLNVVTGVSGSGKSTLAFDIIFAEGQRRFMESMSPYARQFVEQLPRPALDRLTGIPPTVAIEQRITRGSRKSTVATITEVAQYLRLLYARLGVQHHPDTDRPVRPLSAGQLQQLLTDVLASPKAKRAPHLYLCAPLIRSRKGHHQPIATWIARQGYALMRADGRVLPVTAFQKLDRYKEHDIEVVVADLKTEMRDQTSEVRGRKADGENKKSKKATLGGSVLTSDHRRLTSQRLAEALRLGQGACFLVTAKGEVLSWFSTTRTDVETGESFPELDPKHFSFNSPQGWCPACRGHGRIFPWMLVPEEEEGDANLDRLRQLGLGSADDVADEGQPCPECHGERLNRTARAVKLHFRGRRPPLALPALLHCIPAELLANLRALELDARGRLITQDIVPQIEERLRFLDEVGLRYLTLERPTETLSGGEAQRIRLAAQLGTNLAGVLYVLDEPSIGLHARDNDRLIDTLVSLRDKGNTLLVVEHDDGLMRRADRIIDLGPGAGVHGGRLLANDTPANVAKIPASLTGLYLGRGLKHPQRGSYRPVDGWSALTPTHRRRGLNPRGEGTPPTSGQTPWLELTKARFRNLKGFDLRLPPGRLIMVAGPSGAGKSTLFRDLLHPAVADAIKRRKKKLTGRDFVKATGFGGDSLGARAFRPPLKTERAGRPRSQAEPPPFTALIGANGFRTVLEVDQSPIGRTPRSTPATYLGIFDLIRQFFAALPGAQLHGHTASRFSFNTAGGRCEACAGAGRIKFEMAFMPDTFLPCDACGGLRYGPELADIIWKGRSIGEVLRLTFEEAALFFDFHSRLGAVCRLMVDCGLGYLTLGQSSPTLSGGEAQRLKLVTELARGLPSFAERNQGVLPRNLYLLEEPTIGLHLSDCEKLIGVLHSLVDQGHTVVVIEHQLDLLAEADWIVELGPDGGPDGGELIYQGPLAGLLGTKRSPTAPYLRERLNPQKT